jgi:NAD(P)H dehydrogenase (quinone)
LVDPLGHAGQVYPLFGPKELTQFEIAEILSDVLRRKITYVPMEIEEFKGVLKNMGYTPHFSQHVSAVAPDCRDRMFSGTNDWVEKLTGQMPLQMVDYIVKNKVPFS